jgi:hypothetical protein
VRKALLAEQHLHERATQLRARGLKVPMKLLVQQDLARDRRVFLEELAGDSKALRAELKALQKTAEAAKTPEQLRQVAIEASKRIESLQAEFEDIASQGSKAEAETRELKATIAKMRKKVKPEFMELLEVANVNGEDVDLPDKPSTVPTDILVHGISRREGKPMQDMLQALADAAVDCKVLQSLHARMGVPVTCSST